MFDATLDLFLAMSPCFEISAVTLVFAILSDRTSGQSYEIKTQVVTNCSFTLLNRDEHKCYIQRM